MGRFVRFAACVVAGLVSAIVLLWWNPLSFPGNLLSQQVSWGRCTVTYVVSTDHIPVGGVAAVRAAAQRMSAASGITLVYGGTTTEPVPGELRDGAILIGWIGNPNMTVGDLYGQSETIVQRGAITSARITIADSASIERDLALHTYVVEHELGHALGLAHNEFDTTSLMYPTVDASTVHDLSATDITALRRQGKVACSRR